MNQILPEFVTASGLAILARLPEHHVRRLAAAGVLSFQQVGKYRWFRVADADAARNASIARGWTHDEQGGSVNVDSGRDTRARPTAAPA